MKITQLKVAAYGIPTEFPESDGTLEWKETILIIVEIFAGSETGLGMTYADPSVATLINNTLKNEILNEDPMNISFIWEKMVRKTRNLGRPGLTSMAISAIDIALWDLKAKLLHIPLVSLLGGVRNTIPIYGSGGLTSYSLEQLRKQANQWVSQGISMVKIKVGRQPHLDPERIKVVRESVGSKVKIFIDANGAFFPKEALHFIHLLESYNISWFEEPVSSDDLAGLQFIRQRVQPSVQVAAGEYGYDLFYFQKMLEAEAIDILQIDATRCAGITGFIKAATLADAYHIPISAHTAPSIHLHPCCALPHVAHIEYFHDHVRIENELFDGFPIINSRGEIEPDFSRPGMGLEFKKIDAQKYSF